MRDCDYWSLCDELCGTKKPRFISRVVIVGWWFVWSEAAGLQVIWWCLSHKEVPRYLSGKYLDEWSELQFTYNEKTWILRDMPMCMFLSDTFTLTHSGWETHLLTDGWWTIMPHANTQYELIQIPDGHTNSVLADSISRPQSKCATTASPRRRSLETWRIAAARVDQNQPGNNESSDLEYALLCARCDLSFRIQHALLSFQHGNALNQPLIKGYGLH